MAPALGAPSAGIVLTGSQSLTVNITFLPSFFTCHYLTPTMFNLNPAPLSFLFKLYLLRDKNWAPQCVCTTASSFWMLGSETMSWTEVVKQMLVRALVRNDSLCCKKPQGHQASVFPHTNLLFPPRNFVCIDFKCFNVLLQNFHPSHGLNRDRGPVIAIALQNKGKVQGEGETCCSGATLCC